MQRHAPRQLLLGIGDIAVDRRVERALVGEYRSLIETALARLGPETHDRAVAIAELPDEIRGYEAIKMANVKRFRDKAARLIEELN